jgi:hypothetical protein
METFKPRKDLPYTHTLVSPIHANIFRAGQTIRSRIPVSYYFLYSKESEDSKRVALKIHLFPCLKIRSIPEVKGCVIPSFQRLQQKVNHFCSFILSWKRTWKSLLLGREASLCAVSNSEYFIL